MKNITEMSKEEFVKFMEIKCNKVAKLMHDEFIKNGDYSHTMQECFEMATKITLAAWQEFTK